MVPRWGPSAPRKVTVVVAEPPLCWSGSAGDFGAQGVRLVWDGCSGPRIPRSRERHPPQPSLCLGMGVGVGAAPPGGGDPAPSAWVCCCPRGSGDSPGPISLKYPQKRGLNKDPSLPSSAFPRCSYLGENNHSRLCFQQMRVRKRLCDSADKRQPGRGASGWEGAPRQPPVPSRSVGLPPGPVPPWDGDGGQPVRVWWPCSSLHLVFILLVSLFCAF